MQRGNFKTWLIDSGYGADTTYGLDDLRQMVPCDIREILFSTDASLVPELYWLGARIGRRALGRVLDEHIADGAIDEATALGMAEQILWRNSERVYRL